MVSSEENARRWERGCAEDPVRNGFLIPNLIRIVDAAKPANILDIGTGTGYVARHTDAALSYRPQWTLADIDVCRLAIARENALGEMNATILNADVTTYDFDEPFEAILATFTLLEIENIDEFILRLPRLLRPGGALVVSLPDTWRDIINSASASPEIVEEFLRGRASVPKIDKFTNDRYPFRAVRIECLISMVLSSGFALVELIESNENQSRAYLLTFQRRGMEP